MSEPLNFEDQSTKDIVDGMSKLLNVEVEESHNEFCFNIPDEMGSGYVKSYVFDFGVSVLEIDCLLKEDFQFELGKSVVHPLKLIFNREDTIWHKFSEEDDFKEIKRLENVIVASTPKNIHTFKIKKEQPVCLFSLEINRKLFEEKIESFLSEMNTDLIEIFRDLNGVNDFYYKSYYSLEISKFIDEFVDSEHEGFMKKVYLEGKAYEILTHQLQQYTDDLNEPNKRTILRQATIERVHKAVNIIEEEIDTINNIQALAKKVGLNQNTLQQGFKQLHNTSVNEYIRNFRIDKSKELIETTKLNITEITYKVGINSRSYFSKLFKERFGLTPKQYLTKVRSSKSA